jgi:murein DD-endopeptidase MepM/ murein hydrolase activator NlpD
MPLHPKQRERMSYREIISTMLAQDDPLKEKAHPVFGDAVKYRPDIGWGTGEPELLAKRFASRKRWDDVSQEMVSHTGADDDKSHQGIDIDVPAGGQMKMPFGGTVTRVGTLYEGDPDTQYVQITTDNNYTIRFAYVEPGEKIKKGVRLESGQTFGVMKRPTSKAAGWDDKISDHVHIEAVEGKVWDRSNRFDPSELLGVTE